MIGRGHRLIVSLSLNLESLAVIAQGHLACGARQPRRYLELASVRPGMVEYFAWDRVHEMTSEWQQGHALAIVVSVSKGWRSLQAKATAECPLPLQSRVPRAWRA